MKTFNKSIFTHQSDDNLRKEVALLLREIVY